MREVHESEMELPELFERNERFVEVEEWEEPDGEREVLWEKEVGDYLALVGAREARRVAADMGAVVRTLTSPGRIAAEMKHRSDYLRSRPMRIGREQAELEILGELDVIEAKARCIEVQRQLGAISAHVAANETADLAMAVFAARLRFHDLLRVLGEPWPSRARPESAEARLRELRLIEEFLAGRRRSESDAA